MSKDRTAKDYALLVLKGLAMGVANKVPGVSGGIVAFVAGFYEEFIYSLQKFNRKALNLLIKGRYRSFFQYINYQFLFSLILGMLISYFSVSILLDYLINKSELLVWSTFFGMILGSLYSVSKDFREWNRNTYIVCFLGLVMGFGITFLRPASENTNLFFIFFCGIISISGMTLPGLSGSFILLLIGNYVLLLVDSVNIFSDTIFQIFSGDFSFLNNDQQTDMLIILGVFTFGSVVGMIAFSQLLTFLLKKFHGVTTAVIIGFIAGSLGVVWPWKKDIYKYNNQGNLIYDANENPIVVNYERFFPDFIDPNTWLAIFFILLGMGILLLLEYYGRKQKK